MPTQVKRRAPKSPGVQKTQVCEIANAMLNRLELVDAELSVLLTDDETIRRLNREHRNKDRPTDVLSFHFDSRFSPSHSDSPRVLGDIVISLDTAARQALGRRRPLIVELRWLLAHGILHLLGFDHARASQKKKMDSWTRRLVKSAPITLGKAG
jgi:rRNA maturation RNase YbeY